MHCSKSNCFRDFLIYEFHKAGISEALSLFLNHCLAPGSSHTSFVTSWLNTRLLLILYWVPAITGFLQNLSAWQADNNKKNKTIGSLHHIQADFFFMPKNSQMFISSDQTILFLNTAGLMAGSKVNTAQDVPKKFHISWFLFIFLLSVKFFSISL